MKAVWAGCLLCVVLVSFNEFDKLNSVRSFHLNGHAQGTTWSAIYYAEDSLVRRDEIDSVLEMIDSSMSLYKPYSAIVRFNSSKTGVKIDSHFRKVVEHALQVSEETNGLFDITIGALSNAWGFGAQPHHGVARKRDIRRIRNKCTGFKKIRLDGDSLVKQNPCIQLDVNGIAQGYTVDLLAALFESKGLQNYLVEIGGEIRVKGKKQPGGEPFRIAIETPGEENFADESAQKLIAVDQGAVTTSGRYRKFIQSSAERLSHIIDPRTGHPTKGGMISVTVVAKDAIIADAYDNVLMLMNINDALSFAESHGLHAHFVYQLPNNSITDTATANWSKIEFKR